MKIIENLIEKTITKMIKEVDFKTLIKELIAKHKDEILTALKNLLKEAVTELAEKVKQQAG